MEYGSTVLPERFWNKVIPEPMSGCWIWVGASDNKGYGSIGSPSDSRVTSRSHVLMTWKAHGMKPTKSHMALHSCDTPSCVNPDHLSWGTARENSDQMMRRGRSKSKEKFCKRGHDRTVPNALYVSGACKACRKERGN